MTFTVHIRVKGCGRWHCALSCAVDLLAVLIALGLKYCARMIMYLMFTQNCDTVHMWMFFFFFFFKGILTSYSS